YTWTCISTKDDLTDSNQSASAAILCPSAAYRGATFTEVFWDNLFGSFVFFPTVLGGTGQPPLAQGILTGSSGAVMRHRPIDLPIGNKTFHTLYRQQREVRI